MKAFSITGGNRLTGEIAIHGAKNSVLPILAACILCPGTCSIHNCPNIADVDTAVEILQHLGCRVQRQTDTITVDAAALTQVDIPACLMGKMRSSILFIGALLARQKLACFTQPGGCRIGLRPIDFHLKAFEALGVCVEEQEGTIVCTAKQMHAADLTLPAPSVGATENAILAAVGAEGVSLIHNAAKEPEIIDLCQFLSVLGVQTSGAGTETICIQGTKTLQAGEYRVMPDRIETSTYLAAAAACGGQLFLHHTNLMYLRPVAKVLQRSGCTLQQRSDGVTICAPEKLHSPGIIHTAPYPGFPTDAQAPVMAALLRAGGKTLVADQIFENRFQHVQELQKLGAIIFQKEFEAIVVGAAELHGAAMRARELRGGAALVIGALAARGHSLITGVEYIDRGYDRLVENLTDCGAQIKQVEYFSEMVYNTL